MPKNNLKRSVFNPQKIKAPYHLLRFKDEQDRVDDKSNIQLSSLPAQRSGKNDDNFLSVENSAATSVSWSQEEEDVSTRKLQKQWLIVEKSFYEEDDSSPLGSILDECIQWRTQIPYLRIIGKNPICMNDNISNDYNSDSKNIKTPDNLQNDGLIIEHNLFTKKEEEEEEDTTQHKLNKAKLNDILDILMEYIVPELFSNKDSDTNSLCENLNNILQIAPAPVHSKKNLSKNSKINWAEEAALHNYIENKTLSIKNRLLNTGNSLQTITNADHQGVKKRQRGDSVSADKPRDSNSMSDDDILRSKERLHTPHIGRNKLGTIFNERIIVNPVPFAVSTRESFSTIKTVPIRFMNESWDISPFQESARNISDLRSSARKSSSLRNPDIYSTWQAPVCPAIYPKNIRLAPINASRLPSSRNRSLAPSPEVLHCGRRSLSPIFHPMMPKSAHTTYDRSNFLEIEGKHIVPVQSSKINLVLAGWDYDPKITKDKKKKFRAKEGF